MYVEIGSLGLENFQRILDLTTSRPMKKFFYVAVLDRITLKQTGIFCIVGELFGIKNSC